MDAYEWKVGQTVAVGALNDVAFVITGTFTAVGSALETRALAGRRFIQEALGKQGICNNIIVQVDDSRNADETIRYIDSELNFPKKTHTQREKAFMASIAEEMEGMLAFSRWVVLCTLLVILMGVSNTVSMSMKDRIQEIGVLRTLGFRRGTLLWLVLSESTIICMAGGLLAIPLILCGIALFNGLIGELNLFTGTDIAVDIEPWLLLLSLPVSAGAGIFGGIVPAFVSSRWKIVDCFRAVE